MSLVQYEPNTSLSTLQGELDRLLRRWLLNEEEAACVIPKYWMPAVDIKEEESRFVIRIDIPGIDVKDIDLTLDKGTLVISGKREPESKDDQKFYNRVERSYDSFMRRFTLPNTADADKVNAKYQDGVLEILILRLLFITSQPGTFFTIVFSVPGDLLFKC